MNYLQTKQPEKWIEKFKQELIRGQSLGNFVYGKIEDVAER